MKIKLKELLDNRYDARYVVRSYYDSALKGLEDSIKTNDWEEVEDFAHEHLSNGGYVKITDRKTGVEKTLDDDTYFGEDGESFNGEFPLSVTDFDPNYFNKEESMLKEGDTYFYNTKHTPDSVYWYSTKHGFGPGAFPSGATVLDVVEDDENPYKIYIATDKLLNTKALNDFDLKEERPEGETRFSTKDFTNTHFTGKRNREKKITESKEYSREEIQNINIDEIFPDKKDYERAAGLKWRGSTFAGDNSPFVSEASKMAKLIKDPYKLVRRALAVADRWYWGYYDGREEGIFNPFRNRLIEFGFTGKQINDIKEKAWKLYHDHYKDKF